MVSASSWDDNLPGTPAPQKPRLCLQKEEQAMLRACLGAYPSGDWGPLLIYSDWLMEQNRMLLADYIRQRHQATSAGVTHPRLTMSRHIVADLQWGENAEPDPLPALLALLTGERVDQSRMLDALLLASCLAAGGR